MATLPTARLTGAPPTVIAPLVGAISPEISISNVLFPQPLGPTTDTNSPRREEKTDSSQRVTSPAAGGDIVLGNAGNLDGRPGAGFRHGLRDAGVVRHRRPYSATSVAPRLHGIAIRSITATRLNSRTPRNESMTTAANKSGVSSRTCEMSCR